MPTDRREHPILFSAPMVRAILEGRKTQTRRLPSARNCLVDGVGISAKRWAAMQWDWDNAWVDHGPSPAGNPGPYIKALSLAHGTTHRIYPRVQPGDGVWGKETFARNTRTGEVAFRADINDGRAPWCSGWTPAIHMPRAVSRISRAVTRVRVERLQDISEADAQREGCGATVDYSKGRGDREEFRDLWESINGSSSWAANSLVLVYDFAEVRA